MVTYPYIINLLTRRNRLIQWRCWV